MSDDVHSIQTSFGGVAELGKGYISRVDGARILLPLATELKVGDGARYVVHLADGTPAFAGAGRVVEVSDQGRSVRKDQRYETMLDALQFDERSRPVYNYIVAVREATYGQTAAVTPAAVVDDEAGIVEESSPDALMDDEATAYIGRPGGADGSFATAIEGHVSGSASAAPQVVKRSSVPIVMPTGSLRRPALGLQWQPADARPPTARPASGLFRYAEGGLLRPARPPYPAIDRSLWVSPAPRPGSNGASARVT